MSQRVSLETDDPTSSDDDNKPSIAEVINNYYLDIGMQFKPRVGVITSINNSGDLILRGSWADIDTIAPYNGTVWSPSLSEIPDITNTIGRQYSYGALYDGYWDNPLIDYMRDMEIIEPEIKDDPSGMEGASVVRSWANRDPDLKMDGTVNTDENAFYTPYEREIYKPVSKEPKWLVPYNKNSYNSFARAKKREDGQSIYSYDSYMITPYTFSTWYREEDTVKNTQSNENPTWFNPSKEYYFRDMLSEDAKRAVNILGFDILLRDEWVSSTTFHFTAEDMDHDKYQGKYYGYPYSMTSVLDSSISTPLTQDYLFQSIYRALGVNKMTASIYFYDDRDLTINFTPLAEKITVAMDRVNQTQNRVDVFVSRTDLDAYWEKAVEDGVAQEYGISVLNDIDGMYRPFAAQLVANDKDNGIDVYRDDATGDLYLPGTWVELEKPNASDLIKGQNGECSYKFNASAAKKIDYNRTQTMTLGEFCVCLKKLMNIYGEEVLTDKEQEMLLVYYGTKLPYGLPEEQLDAIKYLMAKGIVSDNMVWSEDITLEDMLIILSRVKDKSSRLTFKELSLTYDESLLDQGYYPAQMQFVQDNNVGVVTTTLGSDYSYANAEYFDYYLYMPDEIDVRGKKRTPLMTTSYGSEIDFDNYFLYHGADVTDNISKVDEFEYQDYDSLEIVGYEVLDDGGRYLHLRVKTSVIFKDGALNSDYISNNVYLNINTGDRDDSPACWEVDYRGGIFRNPHVINYANSDTRAFIRWDSNKYFDEAVYKLNDDEPVDLTEYKIDINDTAALAEHNTAKSLICEINLDGTVKEAYTYTKPQSQGDTSKYCSFDTAGWGMAYVDYERYVNGKSISFAANPLLSVVSSLGKMIPRYDIWFYVLCDSSDSSKLSTSIKLGDKVIVDKSNPTVSLDEKTIEYLGENEGRYYYVTRNSKDEQWLSTNLKTDNDTNVNAVYATGYIKQNNTFLVKDTELFDVVETVSDIYYNGNITRLNDDVICLSFDVKGASYLEQVTHTIYMNEKLKLLSVNNMMYKIPDDEVLFVDNTAQGGSYLINCRAVLGWGSGYINTNVSDDGTISLAISTKTNLSDFTLEYMAEGIQNSYTGVYNPSVVIKHDGSTFALPATSPNNFASWFVYNSAGMGTFAVVIKNNDSSASNSIVSTIDDNSPIASRYASGAKWVEDILYTSIGSADWKNSPTLVAVYNLTDLSTCGDYVTSKDAILDATDPKSYEGKFYYDGDIGTWAYIPKKYTTKEVVAPIEDRLAYLNMNDMEKGIASTSQYNMAKLKNVLEFDASTHKDYYNGDMVLPYIYSSTGTIIDVSCNTLTGKPFGTVPMWAVDSAWMVRNYLTSSWTKSGGVPLVGDGLTSYFYPVLDGNGNTMVLSSSLDSSATVSVATTTPANPLPYIMGVKEYALTPDNFNQLRVAYGNFMLVYNSAENKLTPAVDIPPDASRKFQMDATDKKVYLVGVTLTKQLGFLTSGSGAYSYTDSRIDAVNRTTKSSLQDLDQISGVDWDAYTFDTLIHDVDNGLSILLIIVLNIIPRIAMFVFIILIGLSTVADIKIVKTFCHSVFDPYRLITFGHSTVDTIETKTLLITSMIGLAVFGLFMDGTLIKLLTWVIQFVSAFFTR